MSVTGDPFEALEAGRAYLDLSSWWKIEVRGEDAHGWLNDLLSAELDDIPPGRARSSFLLSPTGRIRASVAVTATDTGHLLIQDPSQPARIDALLDPYVLSSDVKMMDRTDEAGLVSIPGTGRIVESASARALGLVEVRAEDAEVWRIRRGVARFGPDLTPDSLPHEVELGESIAFGKGCFLGQEAVAKVRNLGHPPFVLLAGTADAAAPGDAVSTGDSEAGVVTSAAPDAPGGLAVIARVRWAQKDQALRVQGGELRSRGLASAP